MVTASEILLVSVHVITSSTVAKSEIGFVVVARNVSCTVAESCGLKVTGSFIIISSIVAV